MCDGTEGQIVTASLDSRKLPDATSDADVGSIAVLVEKKFLTETKTNRLT
jgi:hypothetical protein